MRYCINTKIYFVHQRSFHYYESPLLTGSEYTYRQTMGHRRGGMLISTGLDGCHHVSQPMRAFGVGLRQQQRSRLHKREIGSFL